MSNRNPMEEYMQRLQTAGRNNFPGGKPPRGFFSGAAAVALLLGGGVFLSNALFNVDGGHRAIKYKRISGVSKEIYAEGKSGCSATSWHIRGPGLTMGGGDRNPLQASLVGAGDPLRRASEAPERVVPYRHQGSADGQHHLPCPVQTRDPRTAPDLPDSWSRLR